VLETGEVPFRSLAPLRICSFWLCDEIVVVLSFVFCFLLILCRELALAGRCAILHNLQGRALSE